MTWAHIEPLVSHLRVFDDEVRYGGPVRHILTVSRLPNNECLISGLAGDDSVRFSRADWRAISDALLSAGYTRAHFERFRRDGSITKHEVTR